MKNSQGPEPQQVRLLWKALSLLAILFLISVGIGVACIGIEVLKLLQNIVLPVAFAVLLAYLLHPLVCVLQRLRLPRSLAVLLLFLLIGTGIGLIALFLGPHLYVQAGHLIEMAPQWLTQFSEQVQLFLNRSQHLTSRLGEVSAAATPHLADGASKLLSFSWDSLGLVLHTVSFAIGLVFTPFFLFYFLADQPRIARHWKEYLPIRESRVKEEIIVAVEQINKYLISFFRGQVLVAAIDGVLLAIGLSLIGVSNGLALGAAACILTIIPYFGIMTVGLATLLVAAYQPDGGLHLVLLAIGVIAAVQTLEGTLISPRIMGNRTGLHPVTVVLSILVCSKFLGPLLGAILAVPLMATLKVLLTRYALIRKPDPADASEA